MDDPANKMKDPRVSVLILNWNGEKLLKEFLPAVIRHTDPALAEIVVADNHSSDASLSLLATEFPGVRVLSLEENFGYAGGYNRAVAQVNNEYVVLLNSDVEPGEGWLGPLVDLLDRDPRVAAVQPKIRAYRDKSRFEYAGACGGYIDRYGFPFCRGRILGVTETDTGQYDEEAEVFWSTGAAFCIRRALYLEAGGLDERFFAHMEEIDLCWRLRNSGYSIKVVPAGVVYHLGGGTLPMNHPGKLFLNYRNSLLMLYKNTPAARRRKIFPVRRAIDLSARILFLLKGEFANARAVGRAYREFRQLKKHYREPAVAFRGDCILRSSILWAFYLRKIDRFSQLTSAMWENGAVEISS
ncbi:MAG: glycosyltransferase family 2 protein [Culturomica sp.]|jgi:GT2 family glycosyltransferase|nr:glycosyltransferase family 2 protein [Culturomica sp.]